MLVFPTDTVYGVGLLAIETANLDSIFVAKRRPADKPIPLLIAPSACLDDYAVDIADYARDLAARHWPGAITLVLRAKPTLPRQLCALDGSVALRVPQSRIALGLISQAGAPIATSSANISGTAPTTTVALLDNRLATQVALIIDGGVLSGQPSTLVSCLGPEPIVLRPGALAL
jgi:tRNA threonylcarbamoyl adenosine modification protein (Sua5/YciO/YrdC/YwlC family)